VFAILNPLNDAVAWVIMRIHTVLGALFGPDTGLAWGLSIAILVIFIRLLLVPLFVKQVNAQRKMAQHAPHLQELRKKYKNDKQRLNEETMKFYKENGVNPLAGCLPLIPQMIVFFSLFSVLRFIADWKPGHSLQYGFTEPVVQSAQRATIFGVHLSDKLLFAHPAPPTHVAIVIALTVVVSASVTFMTVRQSAKRGLMQTNVDPDNPMAQSQKFMQYIVPFFSLTGLYWQYGLVLYWVTTNLWTLGQQFFMFRNWKVDDTQPAGATASAAQGPARPAASGGTARSAAGTARPGAAARPGTGARTASGTGAKPASGPAAKQPSGNAAKAAPGPAAKQPSGTAAKQPSDTAAKPASAAARGGAGNGRAGAAAPRVKAGPGSSGASSGAGRVRTGSAAGDAAAASSTGNGQNGAGVRGLLRLGRAKQDPEPEPEVPTTKVVRQQPVRQARSKRSGKR
jgi:YidC/Oxa1 family membrane protein insertase